MSDRPKQDIAEKILQTSSIFKCSHYLPFWLLTLSKFLLFLTHNMIAALSTTLYGSNGAYAMTLMYIFFILGNFIAPTLNSLVGHNMALLMFFVSIIYTVFAFVATIVTFSSTSETFALSESTITAIFFISSSIVGCAGGSIWIGYGVLNIQLGEHIPKKLLQDWLTENRLEPYEDPKAVLSQLQEAVTGKIMSLGWSILSFNTVIGGLLTYTILHGGQTSETDQPSALNTLFIIFSIISILANVSYFALYKHYNSEMSTKNCQLDSANTTPEVISVQTKSFPSPSAGPITGAASPALFPKTPRDDINNDSRASNEEGALLLNIRFQQQLTASQSRTQNYGSTHAGLLDPELQIDSNNFKVAMTQWEIFIELMKTSYVQLSLSEYTFAGIAFNFVFASFMANTVKETLGLANAPLIITMAYTTNTIMSFFIGDYISTRIQARNMALIGNVIQLLPALFVLFITPTTQGSCDAWIFALFVAGVAGAGDAIHMSSLSTVMAADLKNDTSLLGFRFANVDDLAHKELKEILYSIYSSVKSIGVFVTFLVSGTISFQAQCLVFLTLGSASLFSQHLLRQRIFQQEPL